MIVASNLSIRKRLSTCIAVLVSAMLLQVASGLVLQAHQHGLMSAQQAMTEVTRQQMLGDMKHDAIESDVFRLRDAIMERDAGRRATALNDLNEDIGVIDAAYGFVFGFKGYSPKLQQAVAVAVAPKQDYVTAARAIADRLQADPTHAQGDMNAFVASFRHFEKVQEVLADAIQAEREREAADSRKTFYMSLALAGLALASAAAVVWWVAQTIRRRVGEPLTYLHGELNRMAGGDFSVPINGDPNGDELAQIGAIACKMRLAAQAAREAEQEQAYVVRALSEALERLANHDLETLIDDPFPGGYDYLRNHYNATVTALRIAIGRVRVGAGALANSIGEIRSAADDLARRNEQQAATLEETAASTSEVTSSVRETAADAETVRRAVATTQGEASEGSRVVGQAITAMAAIETSAQEIGQIIGVIDGIAFQTNLLALNAGVEAARAGDAGKGFAVVATEVRALAQRSADAARDIKELISTSSQQVAEGVALVGASGDKLTRISTQVNEVTELIGGIARKAAAQAEHLDLINSAMRDLDLVTQQNAAMVEQTNASARALADEAKELTGQMSRFRTRDKAKRAAAGGDAAAMRRSSLVPGGNSLLNAVAQYGAAKAKPASAPVVQLPPPAPRAAPAPAPTTSGALAVKDDDWSSF